MNVIFFYCPFSFNSILNLGVFRKMFCSWTLAKSFFFLKNQRSSKLKTKTVKQFCFEKKKGKQEAKIYNVSSFQW